MKLLSKIRLILVAFLLAAINTPLQVPVLAEPAQQGQNLLTNPGFEDPYSERYSAIMVANGWTPWWVEPNSSDAFPGYCDYNIKPPSCQPYAVPEFKGAAPFSERIHSGNNTQQWFKSWSIFLAGVSQQVSGVVPGQTYRFSTYIMTWSNDGGSLTSAGQPSMGMQVGIDPTGGTYAFSDSIVFSPSTNSFDNWSEISVETVAQSSTITVYIRSWPALSLKDVNVYVDDASLVAVGAVQPPATSISGPGTVPTVAFVPSNPNFSFASTPLPNGEVWYTVQSGDTLGGIAFRNDTTVDELKQLNNLSSNIIKVNDKLLVKVVTVPPTEPPLPPPTDPPTLAPSLAPSPTLTALPLVFSADYGQLCVVAYNDANNNATNENEPGVADVQVTLSTGTTPLDGYMTTSGESEHCFPQLPPGTYSVSIAPPTGFNFTTASDATIDLKPGNLVTLAFGLSTGEAKIITPQETPVAEDSSMSLLWTGVGLVTVAMLGIGGGALWMARKK
jgi:LysM repeat protein